ncbi:MAG: exodeoxyribonuclease V subunit gamma [Oceanococcus sp.]
MFYLYHHHRLDRLAELQAVLLERAERASVLSSDTILVPNQGVARWLQIQLAESQGIAANLVMPLPAKFIWDTVPQLLSKPVDSRNFERHRLRWHLYALLPQIAPRIPQLQHYLRGESQDVLRLQLADQLADIFDQYLVFRPHMLFAWQAGKTDGSADEHWQSRVWNALLERLGRQHRGQLLHDAISRCEQLPSLDVPSLPRELYCFGLGALPPDYLRFLYALSRHCQVHFLLLNPCEHYWGDIRTQRVAKLAPLEAADAQETQLAEQHPLLASLGRATRDLLRVIYSDELQRVQEPQLGEAMAYQPPGNKHLLAQVQTGVINMRAQVESVKAAEDDRSVQIHACHGPLREVQVLHDQLLDLLSHDEQLQAREIVVMMPDINRYTAAIRCVFGGADNSQFIPWSLSDSSRLASHPIVRSFIQLLNLPLSRWSASEVLNLAHTPAVMRRFELDESALEQLEYWLQQAGVRWGLDASTREQFEAGDHDIFSWRFGLDRLLLGLSQSQTEALFDNVNPWSDLEGGSTHALGQIYLLVERLAHWQSSLQEAADAQQWQQRLQLMLEDLLDSREAEAAELAAMQELQHSIASLDIAHDCIADELLSWASVREVLLAELQQANARQPFLSNGVTFCGMVPLRAVPFKVVCLLGMDDGAFPRQDDSSAINLLRRNPQLGDIGVRDDDRLLFLQALMAAQDVFYVSFTGQDVGSGDALPPAPIVGEWLDFLQHYHFAGESRDDFENAMIVRQPMQPFSPALFAIDPPHKRVFSFKSNWLAASDTAKNTGPLLDQSQRESTASKWVELRDLQRFFDHPARYFLRDVLLMERSLPEQISDDEEPLQLDGLQAWQLREQLLRDAQNDQDIAQQPSATLLRSSLLPPMPLAVSVYQPEADAVRALLPIHALWQRERGEVCWLDIDIPVAGCRLRGRLSGLWPDGPRLLRPGGLRMQYRMRSWIAYLCYLITTQDGCVQMAGLDSKSKPELISAQISAQQAREHLEILLGIYRLGQTRPLPLMPELADMYLTSFLRHADREKALEQVNKALKNRYKPHRLMSDPWFSPLVAQDDLSEDFAELCERAYTLPHQSFKAQAVPE